MGVFGKLFGGDSTAKDKKEEKEIPWVPLTSIAQLDEIVLSSKDKTQVIFKHSTRCGISRMVLKQFTAAYDFDEKELSPYYLDLLTFREVSNAIAEKFQILHQSPQLIVIKGGTAVFHDSHGAINAIDLKEFIL